MEFLRFGSSIPGGYWGCCAVCVVQNFNFDPNSPASIQLVEGDSGIPLTKGGGFLFAGPTWRDIFLQRMRIGTFSTQEMPNHAFFAVLTDNQIKSGVGKKWLAILKEEGFEFLRTQDNSVYTGESLTGSTSPHPNHIFALFRNISGSRIKDPFTPPSAWTDLPSVVPESWELTAPSERRAFADAQSSIHRKHWVSSNPKPLLSLKDLEEMKVPVTLAGQRLPGAAPESMQTREARKAKQASPPPKVSAFPQPVPTAA